MNFYSKCAVAILISTTLWSPCLAQDIKDRTGVSLTQSSGSPLQYIPPDRLAALDTRQLSFDGKLNDEVQREVIFAVDRYRAKQGAALVMDVETGEILAISSVENFNAHPAESGIQFNLVTEGLYEVGISAKAITVAAGLQEKVIKADSFIDVRKPIKFGKYTISDYEPAQTKLSLTDIILKASNIGRVKIAERLGNDTFKKYVMAFGQFKELKVEGLRSVEPKVPSYWSDITTATVSYGHGIATSPLQSAVVMAAMVNGGFVVQPTIYKIGANDAIRFHVISDETSAFMRSVMRENVVRGSGTKLNLSNIKVGGLSGTANKNIGGKYDPDKVVTHFVAVVPADKPKYLVYTMLDEPHALKATDNHVTAGWNAGPMAAKIIKAIYP